LKAPGFRAVILAAGLGTRLHPLTIALPKPLLPVAGMPVLGHTLAALKKSGCVAVAINLHHQGDKIAARFGSEFEGMPLRYSREHEILGTAGALVPLREFLVESEFTVVLNGDSLARWPLAKLLKHQRAERPLATLMVTTRAAVEEFGGGISVARDNRVLSFAKAVTPRGQADISQPADRRRVFAGAHAFCRELLALLPEPPADFVRDLYQPLLDRGERIDAVETSARWFDIGTPRRYLEAVMGYAGRSGLKRRGWWSQEVEVDEAASVKRSVLEAGVAVAAGARVRRSLIMSGASIGIGARVTDSIIGSPVKLPAGTVVESRLVTEARADIAPADNASIVGGLVYSPLD